MVLGWEDEEDGVGCWQASLRSRHIAGCVNKGGMMNCDGLEVPTPALRVPHHHIPSRAGDSLGFLVPVLWDACEGLGHEQRALNICLSPSGCSQELNLTTSSSFGEPGSSEFKVKGSKHPGQDPSQTGDSRGGVCLGGDCRGEKPAARWKKGPSLKHLLHYITWVLRI